jgi:hypothetical protein
MIQTEAQAQAKTVSEQADELEHEMHDGCPAGFARYPGQLRDFQEVSNQTATTT